MAGLWNLIPLVLLFAFLGGMAWFGYQIYLYSLNLAETAKKQAGDGPISFTKDGAKINVKQVKREDYEDSTQRAFVKTWNLANESKNSPRASQV